MNRRQVTLSILFLFVFAAAVSAISIWKGNGGFLSTAKVESGENAETGASISGESISFEEASQMAEQVSSSNGPLGKVQDPFRPQEQDNPFNQDFRRSRSRGNRRGFSSQLLKWDNDAEFKHDVFTFARIQYSYNRVYGRNRWGRPDWAVDMPDSDNNFSFRLQQLTSMKVHFEERGAVVVRLDEKEIYDYPFCYLIEPGEINLTRPEIEGMRKYLNRGGFIMVDDFWGNDEWYVFKSQMKRVFPDLEFTELDLDHPIFNIVYKLDKKPQIPSIGYYYRGQTSDRWDANEAHYWELKSKDGRPMMIVCHNTDLGDGWEREGMDSGYFKTYSERWAYPLGINILTYAMTH